jgi:hypothetical protein
MSVGDIFWSGFGIIFFGVLLDKLRASFSSQRFRKKLCLYESAYYYKMVGVSTFMVKS